MILGKEGLPQLVRLYFHGKGWIKCPGSERQRKAHGFPGFLQTASKLLNPGKQPSEVPLLFLVWRMNPAPVRRRRGAPADHSQNPSGQLNPVTPRPTPPAVIYGREDPQGNK